MYLSDPALPQRCKRKLNVGCAPRTKIGAQGAPPSSACSDPVLLQLHPGSPRPTAGSDTLASFASTSLAPVSIQRAASGRRPVAVAPGPAPSSRYTEERRALTRPADGRRSCGADSRDYHSGSGGGEDSTDGTADFASGLGTTPVIPARSRESRGPNVHRCACNAVGRLLEASGRSASGGM